MRSIADSLLSVRRRMALRCCAPIVAVVILASLPASAGETFTVIDVNGATGTYLVAINDGNVATGFYADAQQIDHGFIRAVDGTITSFETAREEQRRTSPPSIPKATSPVSTTSMPGSTALSA